MRDMTLNDIDFFISDIILLPNKEYAREITVVYSSSKELYAECEKKNECERKESGIWCALLPLWLILLVDAFIAPHLRWTTNMCEATNERAVFSRRNPFFQFKPRPIQDFNLQTVRHVLHTQFSYCTNIRALCKIQPDGNKCGTVKPTFTDNRQSVTLLRKNGYFNLYLLGIIQIVCKSNASKWFNCPSLKW